LKHRILFKLSASIACYKACHLISRLIQNGYEVQTVCTPATFEFIGASTLEGLTGRPVLSNIFAPGRAMDHINLMKWSELVIVCPATANQINKMAAGIGDDPLSVLFLAHDFKKPYWVVPAMNEKMWQHPATQDAQKKLRSWGVKILEPAVGRQACGDVGPGRMLEPETIESLVDNYFRQGEVTV